MKKHNLMTGLMTGGLTLSMFVGAVAPVLAADVKEYTIENKKFTYWAEGKESDKEYTLVTNPNGGPTLSFLKDSVQLLEVEEDGYKYAFKDMDRDNELDVFEDWREETATRAKDLSTKLSVEEQAGLMLFSSHVFTYDGGLSKELEENIKNDNLRCILNAAGNNVVDAVKWVDTVQAYIEETAKANGTIAIPANFSSDPRSTAGRGDTYSDMISGNDISKWPNNLGLAATFDTEQMYNFAKASSAEYRALGITTALGPQIDLASEPRWCRVNGTFGEGVELSVAMTQAYVDGSQSTYDADGKDLGWGNDSINCMIKHWVGEGAGEAGREGHTFAGKYGVYPGNNFAEHLRPFTEGGFNLQGKTKKAAAVMTSYTIGIKADGNPIGNGRGSGYDTYKMHLLRDTYKYDGTVCTDWGVTSDSATQLEPFNFEHFGMAWGVEDLTIDQRHLAIIENDVDMFGGNNDSKPVLSAFNMLVEEKGQEAAEARFTKTAERILTLAFNTGSFENPYLDMETSKAIAGSKDKVEAGYAAQLASVVMIKNKDNTIQKAADREKAAKDMVVYIPYTLTDERSSLFGKTPAAWSDSVDLNTAKTMYKEVITDKLIKDEKGNITGVETPDLSNVDMVIVGMRSPMNGDPFSSAGGDVNTGKFYPLSLQYGKYIADGKNVRKESISSGADRSYFGETSKIFNSYDLTAFENSVKAVKKTGKDIPVVVYMNTANAFIPAEFEKDADAIVCGFSVSDKAVLDVINGNYEPRGLLPFQLPINMDTVEKQKEDVARDVECYVDSLGYTYDFGFGLNWSGVIKDERIDLYKVVTHDVVKPIDPDNPDKPDTPDTPETPDKPAKPSDPIDTSDPVYYTAYVALGAVALAGIVVVSKKHKRKA